jgi:hypothetical protein
MCTLYRFGIRRSTLQDIGGDGSGDAVYQIGVPSLSS